MSASEYDLQDGYSINVSFIYKLFTEAEVAKRRHKLCRFRESLTDVRWHTLLCSQDFPFSTDSTVCLKTLTQTIADMSKEKNCLAALTNDVVTVKFTTEILSIDSVMLNTLLKMQTESLPAGDFIYL